MTTDGGLTWATTALPSTAGLADYSISCPSASVCYVVGTDLVGDTVLLATHDAGSRWTVGHSPPGVIVTSIGCGGINACIAVGSNLPSRPASSILTTRDGGITWVADTAPTNDMITVRCNDEQHCWAAGPGAWFTPDLGATWRDMSPPSGPPCATLICSVYYSETIDIEFQSREDGWVVGGDQCGGQTATECQGVAMRTSDGGLTWTVSDASLRHPFGWQIACEGATCLLDAQGFSFSVIAATTNNGTTFTEMQRVGTRFALPTPRRARDRTGQRAHHRRLDHPDHLSIPAVQPDLRGELRADPRVVVASIPLDREAAQPRNPRHRSAPGCRDLRGCGDGRRGPRIPAGSGLRPQHPVPRPVYRRRARACDRSRRERACLGCVSSPTPPIRVTGAFARCQAHC